MFQLRFLKHSPTSHELIRCCLSGSGTCNVVVVAVGFVVVSVGLTSLCNLSRNPRQTVNTAN